MAEQVPYKDKTEVQLLACLYKTMNQGYITQYKLIPILIEKGFQVSVPCDVESKYDFLLDTGISIHKIQVKSCNIKKRNRYKVDIAYGAGNKKRAYPKGSIDFFVIHIPVEDSWYIIPLQKVIGQKWVSVYPHEKQGKYEIYRNNWKILFCS